MSASDHTPKERDTSSPGWDIPENGVTRKSRPSRFRFGGSATWWALSDRFDRFLPPHKSYLGRSRRTLLVGVFVIAAVLLGLIVGLSVALTLNKTRNNLPLPNGAETFDGDLTFYEPGLGACGVTSTSSDDIVSISHYTFDAVQSGSNPNANELCGRKIRAQRKKGGKTVSVDMTVVDRCTGCEPTDIDVSTAVFDQLADRDQGRVLVTWAWL